MRALANVNRLKAKSAIGEFAKALETKVTQESRAKTVRQAFKVRRGKSGQLVRTAKTAFKVFKGQKEIQEKMAYQLTRLLLKMVSLGLKLNGLSRFVVQKEKTAQTVRMAHKGFKGKRVTRVIPARKVRSG